MQTKLLDGQGDHTRPLPPGAEIREENTEAEGSARAEGDRLGEQDLLLQGHCE